MDYVECSLYSIIINLVNLYVFYLKGPLGLSALARTFWGFTSELAAYDKYNLVAKLFIIMNKVRDKRIDSVKYWLIVLVILGHMLERNSSSSPECGIIRNWIYLFHMPLFIFISGYFSHKESTNCSLFNSIWKLAEPLLIFQSLLGIYFYFMGTFTWIDFFSPWFSLWYLLCLIYYRLLIQIIPDKILSKTKLIICTTSCISIIAGFLPFGLFLSLQRALAFMPFFFIGYFMKGYNLYLPKGYKRFCFLFLIFSFFIPLKIPQYLGDLNHLSSYTTFYNMFSRLFVFCLSIPMSISFINICPYSTWSALEGKFTLQYFIFHSFMLLPIMTIVNKLGIPHSLPTAIFCSILILIFLGIASYLPYFSKFTNPSLFFKKMN